MYKSKNDLLKSSGYSGSVLTEEEISIINELQFDGFGTKSDRARKIGKAEMSYLGTSLEGEEYSEKMERSKERFSMAKREGLFAIVLHAGGGKTTLCDKYGFLDIDECLSTDEHNGLVDIRFNLVDHVGPRWLDHNNKWFRMLNTHLNMLDLSGRTLVLVHTEECALEIGATIIGAVCLDKKEFRKNVSGRKAESRLFAEINRKLLITRTSLAVEVAKSNDNVEEYILKKCNIFGIPTACPNKFGYTCWNESYKQDVPEYILRGEPLLNGVDEVLNLFDEGRVPKVCVDYYVGSMKLAKIRGFGLTGNMWSRAIACIRMFSNKPSTRYRHFSGVDFKELFPPESSMEWNRMNVNLRKVYNGFNLFEDVAVNGILRRHIGERHNFVLGLVLHWLAIGQFVTIPQFERWYWVKFDKWTEVYKVLHQMFRDSHYFINRYMNVVERQKLMYMHLLEGRELYKVDTDEVYRERSLPGQENVCLSYDVMLGIWSREQYEEDFDDALSGAYSRMYNKSRPIRVGSFLEYWKMRRMWITKGSLVRHNLDKDLVNYVLKVLDDNVMSVRRRHNKASITECVDLMAILDYVREDFNVSSVVPKYELAKHRALLPGSLLHYIVFSYVLALAELQEQVGSVRLNAMPDEDIRYFETKMCDGICHLLYDWSNFNAQHSARSMYKVIDMLQRVVHGPEDYSIFVNAIADSMYNMKIDLGQGRMVKVTRGLYSGWRGTTWINSVLNYVYLAIGEMNYRRLYDRQGIVFVDHGGDDVDAGFRTFQAGLDFYCVMERIGNEATISKQGLDSFSEFYRVTVTDRLVLGSPTRALAGFVSGNWEGTGSSRIIDRVNSIGDQLGKMCRRGCDSVVCRKLYIQAVEHWAKVKPDKDWVKFPRHVLHGSQEQGGLGVPDEDGNLWRYQRSLPPDSMEGGKVIVPGTMSSSDYISELESELKVHKLVLRRKEALTNKLAEGSFDTTGLGMQKLFKKMNSHRPGIIIKYPAISEVKDYLAFEAWLAWMSSSPKLNWVDKYRKYAELEGFVYSDGVELNKSEICNAVCGVNISGDVLDFKGDVNYRRLVPEFLATYITEYCIYMISILPGENDYFKEVFKILCYMCWKIYGHLL